VRLQLQNRCAAESVKIHPENAVMGEKYMVQIGLSMWPQMREHGPDFVFFLQRHWHVPGTGVGDSGAGVAGAGDGTYGAGADITAGTTGTGAVGPEGGDTDGAGATGPEGEIDGPAVG
jgi:hypothetical protein